VQVFKTKKDKLKDLDEENTFQKYRTLCLNPHGYTPGPLTVSWWQAGFSIQTFKKDFCYKSHDILKLHYPNSTKFLLHIP